MLVTPPVMPTSYLLRQRGFAPCQRGAQLEDEQGAAPGGMLMRDAHPNSRPPMPATTLAHTPYLRQQQGGQCQCQALMH